MLIGDNLSTHFAPRVIKAAEENDVAMIALPANSTHITQPLDVSFFGPLKSHWRKILSLWKEENLGKNLTKDVFPQLLRVAIDSMGVWDHPFERP